MLKMLSIFLLILGSSLCNAQLTNSILGLTDMISNVLSLSNSQLVIISDFNSESKVLSHEFVFYLSTNNLNLILNSPSPTAILTESFFHDC